MIMDARKFGRKFCNIWMEILGGRRIKKGN
jgi:hypothetical protein